MPGARVEEIHERRCFIPRHVRCGLAACPRACRYVGETEVRCLCDCVLRDLVGANAVVVAHSAVWRGVNAAAGPGVVSIAGVADVDEVNGEGIGPAAKCVGAKCRVDCRHRKAAGSKCGDGFHGYVDFVFRWRE